MNLMALELNLFIYHGVYGVSIRVVNVYVCVYMSVSLCSGAEVVSHMRGPQDAVQLGLFLGVPTAKVLHCTAVLWCTDVLCCVDGM